jgi:hypothetical protein
MFVLYGATMHRWGCEGQFSVKDKKSAHRRGVLGKLLDSQATAPFLYRFCTDESP